MRLFDLNPEERKDIKRMIIWHSAYICLVAVFFAFIYSFGYFKAKPYLREKTIFLFFSPICTLLFVVISPWRHKWLRAIINTYERLEGELIFCIMAAIVFTGGFYIYSLFIWGLGALGPSLFHM